MVLECITLPSAANILIVGYSMQYVLKTYTPAWRHSVVISLQDKQIIGP